MTYPVHQDPRCKLIAIDPGVNGAWAVFSFQDELQGCGDLPKFDKALNAVELAGIFTTWRPERTIIERVSSMPGQGVSSTFTFGQAFGVAIGIASAVGSPLTYVNPGKWKSHFRLGGRPKDASRELAIRLYPDSALALKLKKHHGRAEAILLGRYAIDMEKGEKFA